MEKESLGESLRAKVSDRDIIHTLPKSVDELVFYNEKRVDITQSLILNPAFTHGEISRYLDVNSSSIQWHLEKLAKRGICDYLEEGDDRLYFPLGLYPDLSVIHDVRLLVKFKNRQVIRILIEEPGSITGNIVTDLGISRNTLRNRLEELQKGEMVTVKKDGRNKRVFPSERISLILEASRDWYRNYRSFLVEQLRVEQFEVETDLSEERDLLVKFEKGEVTGTIRVPKRLRL